MLTLTATPKRKTEFASVEFNSGCFLFVVVVVFQLRVTYFACLNKLNNLIFFRLCHDFLLLKVNVSRRKSK